MTRDEAIDILRCRKDGDVAEALEVLLRITEAQPCEDAVSREAVLDILKQECSEIEQFLAKQIRELPSVQLERPIGYWIGIDDYPYDDWECGKCGGQVYRTNAPFEEYKYCPNCGARMEEEQK